MDEGATTNVLTIVRISAKGAGSRQSRDVKEPHAVQNPNRGNTLEEYR